MFLPGTLKPNSPESFVINFENINTPSSSMSEASTFSPFCSFLQVT